jgi:hypothetical protein
MNVSYFYIAMLGLVALLIGCNSGENPIPEARQNADKQALLRGTWVPVELQLRYAIGVAPTMRDTTVTLTPTTAPLLYAGRATPIRPFTDTLVFGTTARADTFLLRTRGLTPAQQGFYSVIDTEVDGIAASAIRVGRVTTRNAQGQPVRYNYDVRLHGTVVPAANGSTPTTCTGYKV